MVCTTGDADAVANLVACGADVNKEVKQFDDDPSIGPDGYPLNPEDDGGKRKRTPLLAAAYGGHLGCVDALLGLRADVAQGKSDDGATPLFMASQGGHLAVVQTLLHHKGDPNVVAEDDGCSPITMA
eukprot:gene27762-34434_t